jgi:hypothetical protein
VEAQLLFRRDRSAPTLGFGAALVAATGSLLRPLAVKPHPPFLHPVIIAVPQSFASALATRPSFFADFYRTQCIR